MPIVPPFPGRRATLSAFFPVAHRDREEGLRLDICDGPYAFLPGPTGDPLSQADGSWTRRCRPLPPRSPLRRGIRIGATLEHLFSSGGVVRPQPTSLMALVAPDEFALYANGEPDRA